MVGRTLVLAIALFASLLLFFVFLSPADLTSRFSLPPSGGCAACQPEIRLRTPPLRVYMYDLPRRFNVGMLERRRGGGGPVDRASLPPWPRNSGLKKQHSVEYWMMASLLAGEGEEGGGAGEAEAVRVKDADEAEAFFVPFFSSLSFNTHGHNMTDPDTEIDRQLQVVHF